MRSISFIVLIATHLAVGSDLELRNRTKPGQKRCDDISCGPGEVCEMCPGPICVEGCLNDNQCDIGQECQSVQCIACPCPAICLEKPCQENTDCAIGTVCDAGGCVKRTCKRNKDCPSGMVCEAGGPDCDAPKLCVPGCRKNRHCELGEECKTVQCVTCPCPGVCTKRTCQKDADCPRNMVCEYDTGCLMPKVCVPGCHDDSQCRRKNSCDTSKTCLTCPCPGECIAQ